MSDTSDTSGPGTAPRQVLVVEDEALLALDMHRTITGLGHEVIGPANTIEEALGAIEASLPDLALLDVNLGNGQLSFPIARVLRDAGVPFAFLTGYAASAENIDPDFRDVRRLSKPCSPSGLAEAIRSLAS